jgi:hypothetical protein
MNNTSDADAESVKGQIDFLTTQIMYASENGLFARTGLEYKNNIDKAIIGADAALKAATVEADAALKGKKIVEASALVYEAKRYFDEVWNTAPKVWLALFGRGWMHHLCTVLGTCMAGLILYLVWQDDFCCFNKCSALFGLLGAVVRSLYWITRQANARTLRRVWATQNVFGPLLGMILGCIAYFLLRSSLVVVTQDNTQPNEYAVVVLAFYAGFNWEWILTLLNKVASQINTKSSDSQKR